MLIDLVAAVLAVTAFIKGFQKGLVVAAFSFLALIIGLAAALKLSAVAAGYLGGYFSVSARWLPLLAFITVFVLVVLLIRAGAKALESVIEMAMLGWLNRLGGILLYTLLYVFVFSLFLFYAVQLRLVGPDELRSSVTYPFIRPLAPGIMDTTAGIFPVFRNMFAQLEAFFGRVPGPDFR